MANVLKIARQNALLGLYPQALSGYARITTSILDHTNAVQDLCLRDQWKQLNDGVRAETQAVSKLLSSISIIKGPAFESMTDVPSIPRYTRPAQYDPYSCPALVQRQSPTHQQTRELSNSNCTIYVREPRNSEPVPKKDPDVWDPPSPLPPPKHRPRKEPLRARPQPGGRASNPGPRLPKSVVNYK